MIKLNDMENVSLRDRIDELVEYIKDNDAYLEHNDEALEIYEGDLEDKVREIMQNSLSPDYFKMIDDRLLPINFLPRIIDKMAQVYSNAPKRTCDEQQFVDNYSKWFDINAEMGLSDEYANLFKGYALEPYISSNGKPSLRSIPFNQFLVLSDDEIDKKNPTVFIKFMGTYEKKTYEKKGVTTEESISEVPYFIAYSKDEIMAFDMEGDELVEITAPTEGLNPIGRIPFVYGNRSKERLLPTQDTDLLQMIKMFPVFFSDLGGAVMFQCFTILYGININTDGIKMAPNAFWDLKSDGESDQKPEVGTIKPEADVEKVLSFVASIFSAWAESKSIRVNSIGKESAESFASGVSKAIDEMDTFMVRKKNIPFFKKEERDLWYLMALMNNYWLETDQIDLSLYEAKKVDVLTVIKSFVIEFEPPRPVENRNDVVNTQVTEINNRFTSRKRAIEKINPELSETEVEVLIQEIDEEDFEEENNDLSNNNDGQNDLDNEEKEDE